MYVMYSICLCVFVCMHMCVHVCVHVSYCVCLHLITHARKGIVICIIIYIIEQSNYYNLRHVAYQTKKQTKCVTKYIYHIYLVKRHGVYYLSSKTDAATIQKRPLLDALTR